MSSINDILNQYAAIPAPQDPTPTGISSIVENTVAQTSPDKMAQVAAASNQKKEALGMSPAQNYNSLYGQMNDVGNDSASVQEQDLRNLSPGQYATKYGMDAFNQAASGQAEAARQITSDENAASNTDGVSVITDGIQGVGQGLINSVGGIAALGAGLVNNDAGQSISDSLMTFNNNVNANKSDAQQSGQRLVNALTANTERDSETNYKQDVKDNGALVASLKQIGRDTVNSIGNSMTNPSALADGTAQGIGSLLTAGPLAKGIGALGRAVIPQVTRESALLSAAAGSRGAQALVTAGEKAPILAAIGATEAGGTYQQTNSDISGMSFDDLAKQSPEFVRMTKPVSEGGEGKSQEEARSQLANSAGLFAAALQFPLAAATGTLVSKFEANPLATKGVRTLLQNSGKEFVEEGIQSGTSQVATNLGKQQEALPDQSLTQGVGTQIGQGALYGLTSAGIVSGPGSLARSAINAPVNAVKGTIQAGQALANNETVATGFANVVDTVQRAADAVKSAAKPGIDWLAARGDEVYKKMQESSPVSDTNMAETAKDVMNNAPDRVQAAKDAVEASPITDEQKAATNEYLDTLSGSLDFHPEDFASAPAYVQKAVDGSTNQIEAMQKMAGFINDEKNTPQERFMAATMLNAIVNGSRDYINSNADALANLPADHPAYQFANGIEDLHASLEKSQSMAKAQEAMDKLANNATAYDIVKPVDESTINTPEGQQNVQAQIALATVAPDKINPDDAAIILQQAKNGTITLNNNQSKALNTAIALVRSAKEYAAQSQQEGWSKADKTAYSLTADENNSSGNQSVLSHAKGIYSAYASGDNDLARDRLEHLMQLAVHMNGKVSTANTHFTTVANPNSQNALNYLQLQPDRSWKMTTGKDTVGVTPTSPNSLKFARRIAGEAKFVTDVANNMAEAFSDLGVPAIDHVNLDNRLAEGDIETVAQEFRNGTRKAGANETAPTTQTVTAEPATVQPEQSGTQFEAGQEVIWANKDHDIPVVYRGNDEVGPDGQVYSVVMYEGKPSYVAKSELRVMEKPTVTESASVIEEAKPVPEVVAETAPVVKEETKSEPTTVAEAFPTLVSPNRTNYFHNAFALPKTKRSRTQGTENPIAEINAALESNDSLVSFSGSKVSNNLTPEVASAYQGMMRYARDVVKSLNQILRADIASQVKDGNGYLVPTNADALKSIQGKSLNIVETLPNGVIRYNPELIQNAVLAGIQWALTSYNQGSNLDAEEVGKILGMDSSEVTPELLTTFNNASTTAEAMRTLSDKISKYWGLSENKSDYDGFVKGIPSAVAGEVMRAFEDAGLVTTVTQNFSVVDDEGNVKPRAINFTQLNLGTENNEELTKTLLQYPSAIDDAVLTEPEERRYTGDERPSVAKTQMRNAEVKNTPQQLAVLANVQNTPYRLHMPAVNFLNYIGMDGVRNLFGAGDIDNMALNVNDREALKGRNQSFTSAFEELQNLQADLENRLTEEDGDIGQTDIFYAFNFSRVNRLQMMGRYNPQASKLMRIAVSPSYVTVDTTVPENQTGMYLAMAQALGIKIHNQPHPVSVAQVTEDLAGKYDAAVQMFREFNNDDVLSDDAIQILHDAGLVTPDAVMAVQEYARYLDADKKAFSTPLFVEADGVTNGIANATQMLSSGGFTLDYHTNSQRTGLFFGSDYTDLNTYRQADKTDLYASAGTDLTAGLNQLKRSLTGKPDVQLQMTSLQGLMDMFLPGAEFDGKGNLNIDRKVTKNPLTITVYGSSQFGIAGNITDALINEIYAGMSLAAQRQANNPDLSFAEAMFGDGGQAKFDSFAQYLNDLTSTEARYSSKNKSFFTQAVFNEDGVTSSPEAFTISGEQRNSIRTNVNSLFVTPMIESIGKTVGQSVLSNMTDIRMATQAISILQQNMFNQLVEEAQAARLESDPTYKKHYLLSQSEQNAILKKVLAMYPPITTGTQTFFIGGSNNAYTSTTNISRARDGQFAMAATMYGPTDSGVAGAAYLNIGMGDGQMIQSGFTGRDSVKNALPVFDGVNLRLDRLMQDSQKLNGSVFDSWGQNPMAQVLEALKVSLGNIDTKSFTPEMIKQLSRALTGNRNEVTSPDTLVGMLGNLSAGMENASRSIDARHKALRQFNVNVDQMASMAAPYTNTGAQLSNDPAAAIAQLNEAYHKIMKGDVSVAPKQEGTPVKSGVISSGSKAREISMNMLNGMVKSAGLTGTKKAMFDEIRRSAAAKGYKIITGTREELMAYNEGKGLKHDQSNFTNLLVDGFISPATKEIYIINSTAQTMLHELIHASTFETVLDHYQGNTTPEVTQAVTAIEGMMDQFLKLSLTDLPNARAVQDYNDARAAIVNAQANQDVDQAVSKASALNEFMAWSLATQSLNDTLAKTPILQRITDAVFNAIRKLVYGRKRIPAKPGDDILSNLMFHTGVIVRGQASTAQSFADTKLYQSRQYGNSDRLTEINKAFDASIVSYIREATDVQVNSNRQTEATEGLILGNDIANSFINHGFPMGMQEATTFSMIVSALATQAHIDPASMNRAQELFDHVTEKLNIGHFLPANFTQQDEFDATEKYNSIMGRYQIGRDRHSRSTLLPAFMALAITNDEFRNVLNTIGLPESQKGNGTLDGTLESLGNNALDNLGRRMAGDIDNKTVKQAVDALTQRILDVAQNRETFIDQYAGPLGNIMDRANEIVSEKLESLSDKIWDTAENVKGKTSNKYIQGLANSAKVFAAIASESKAGLVAEGVSAAINRLNGRQYLTDIISDIVGRTASNQDVYDLIKRFRTAIQQDRQQFRDALPGIIASKFSRELTNDEWSTLHKALGKTDIISLAQHFNMDEIHALMQDGRTLRGRITAFENRIAANDPKNSSLILKKAQQLAYFMMGNEPGKNLLRNAEAIGRLLGETAKPISSTTDMVKDIDGLVSLYAIEQLSRTEKDSVFSLVQSEANGMDFVMSYLKGQRAEEQRKVSDHPATKFNNYKGYIPSERDSGITMIVANDFESAKLESMSLKRISDYQGSSAEPGKEKRGYYFGNVQSRTLFNQGLMQNVRQSANGVDASTGYTLGMLAGRITDQTTVKAITARLRAGETGEALLPVYNDRGSVVAYERSVDQNMQEKMGLDTNIAQMIGNWRGRQVEEVKAEVYNEVLVDTLHSMYEADLKASRGNQDAYVNVFSDKLDPVLQDAVNLMPREVRNYARSKFGEAFYVRKDMLNDTFGYRDATIGDAWTGNARWKPETLSTARRVAMGMFGADAYRLFTNAEKTVQNFVQDARTLIIVKSVVVPFANAVSNVLQLVGRGVPIKSIVTGTPRKLAEINTYVKNRIQEVEAEADLLAAENNPLEQRRLKTKIQSIQDGYRRMSIWPLLEAGEFSAITDASLNSEDIELSSGKLNSFIEKQIDKLPKSLQTAGRYALVTKDTALFKALEKSVEYGDFVAKAILFDDITRRQKKTTAQALAAITEEFINYDRLPGRFRGYMEKTGLLWFYNYKVRAVKVALSTIRNNPVHALFAANLPLPDMFGSIGSPITDNLVTQLADGGLSYSVGMGQAFNAPFLNPWVNLAY